jgi:hypothetical protein
MLQNFLRPYYLHACIAGVPGRPLQISLMLLYKAGAYLNEAPFICDTLG